MKGFFEKIMHVQHVYKAADWTLDLLHARWERVAAHHGRHFDKEVFPWL